MKAQPSKQRAKSTRSIPKGSHTKKQSSAVVVRPEVQQPFDDLHAQIIVRAYYLYVERGRREGGAEQDWLDAEREILNRSFHV